jgi:hypothetical protein
LLYFRNIPKSCDTTILCILLESQIHSAYSLTFMSRDILFFDSPTVCPSAVCLSVTGRTPGRNSNKLHRIDQYKPKLCKMSARSVPLHKMALKAINWKISVRRLQIKLHAGFQPNFTEVIGSMPSCWRHVFVGKKTSTVLGW